MKFCFLASREWHHPEAAGGDLYLGNIAQGLAERGHKIVFVASSDLEAMRYQKIDGVDVYQLKPGTFYPLRLLITLLALKRSTDIIVEEVFGGKGVPPFAMLFSRKPLISMWYQRHDKIFAEQYPKALARILSIMERVLARLYSKACVVTLSQKSAKELTEIGLPQSHLEIVPSASTLDSLPKQEVTHFQDREDSIVFIGKIRKYKRVDHAILALSQMASLGFYPRLVIAGNLGKDGHAYCEALRSLARRLGVERLVDFRIYPSIIPSYDKIDLLTSAKILVQTSPVEGFGMTTVEANACGTPVVVSDGVPGDTVVQGGNGFVYPFGDINSMAHHCIRLLTEECTWEHLSANSLEMASRYTWNASVDRFLTVVKRRWQLDEVS